MILITSAAFISDDLTAELGRTPPSFLPIGNRRLFEHQLRLFEDCTEKTFISLPETYLPEKTDTRKLKEAGAATVPVPEGLSLGASVSHVLDQTKPHWTEDGLKILHGDTLLSGISTDRKDIVSVATNDGYYERAVVQKKNGHCHNGLPATQFAEEGDLVLSGYFSFSDTAHFRHCLSTTDYDFVQALRRYGQDRKIEYAESGTWLDFGHLNSFFRSRAKITTQRSFNSLSIANQKVTKSSADQKKINSEYLWFTDIPGEIKLHTPRVLDPFCKEDEQRFGYSSEYLHLLPLNDLFVYANHSQYTWRKIFDACGTFLSKCREHMAKDRSAVDIAGEVHAKTRLRLSEFARTTGFRLDQELTINGRRSPSLNEIAKRSLAPVQGRQASTPCVVHGDFCMSNILYDFRSQSIKVLDPRGLNLKGDTTVYGDQNYDYAKLYHSVIGLYDFIIADRYTLEVQSGGLCLDFDIEVNQDTHQIQEQFSRSLFAGFDIDEAEVLSITIHLFLSMLPLHSDSFKRQCAFIANAIRLYEELIDRYPVLRG
ncbi:hypothetical protein [Oricola sp.]|uniref:hypothetical protein n=1 Tax=Oricola sp. TaxID=1979950 RepID=UPI003BAA3BA3